MRLVGLWPPQDFLDVPLEWTCDLAASIVRAAIQQTPPDEAHAPVEP